MPSETPFRIALALIMLASATVAGYYRWRAAASGERISRKEEGYLFAILLRLAGAGLWIATLLYLVAPATVRWGAVSLPAWVRWCGVAGGACGPLFLAWTLASLGRNLTDTVVTRAQATLVTHGPYRWVRHPFYVATGWLMLSVSVLAANWAIGASCLLVLLLLALRTPKEEQMLIERFGDEYRQYMAKTGRFLPRLPRR